MNAFDKIATTKQFAATLHQMSEDLGAEEPGPAFRQSFCSRSLAVSNTAQDPSETFFKIGNSGAESQSNLAISCQQSSDLDFRFGLNSSNSGLNWVAFKKRSA